MSKIVARSIRSLRNPTPQNKITRHYALTGEKRDGTVGRPLISAKWRYLVDAPFLISEKCCDILKKEPIKRAAAGLAPIVGTMAAEGGSRVRAAFATSCNNFSKNKSRRRSAPLTAWTQDNVLEYTETFNLSLPSVYGQIKTDSNGKRYTTRESRTGCVCCLFGVHMERGENRIQRLAASHPKYYKYCMEKLDIGRVMEYLRLPYEPNLLTGVGEITGGKGK